MTFVSHPIIRPDKMEEREYQTNILKTAIEKNTLVVLPTGTGKTNISVLLAAHRLDKYPDSKILIISPTRPLCAQHQKSFEDYFKIIGDISLITGVIAPEKRKKMYDTSVIIIATPQTIQNDVKHGLLNLREFSMLTVDEAHKAVGNYAYTYVVERYSKQSQFPRILALTASPGSTRDKIDLIRKNLYVDAVEIRTELDADVKPYIKEKEIEYAKVELTEELQNIQSILKGSIKSHLDKLREYDIYASSKRELLDAQKSTSKRIAMEKQPYLYHLVASIAQTVKIWHLLELLETQSIQSTKNYIDKIKLKETASDKRIMNDVDVLKAMKLIEAYKTEHPKIEKIKQIIIEELENNEKAKIIVFSHFRDNIDTLNETLKEICRPVILIGQSGEHGLSQKEQINVIRDYECDIFNCLITSPIGEEGLDIHGGADIGIFYDSVPSEIRTIQRRGRVGRTKVGKVIMMLTKNTRDEIYHYSAQRKEKNMKTILKSMQNKNTLGSFIKKETA